MTNKNNFFPTRSFFPIGRKGFVYLLMMGSALVLEGCGKPKIVTHPLPQPYPTEMTMNASVPQIKKAIQGIFGVYHKENLFGEKPDHGTGSLFLQFRETKNVFSEKTFDDPANKDDAYLTCMNDPICKSTVYFGSDGKPLDYIADFQIHLVPQGNGKILVRIFTFHSEVISGERFGFGSCGPGMANVYAEVKPTTVEENKILSLIQRMSNE